MRKYLFFGLLLLGMALTLTFVYPFQFDVF